MIQLLLTLLMVTGQLMTSDNYLIIFKPDTCLAPNARVYPAQVSSDLVRSEIFLVSHNPTLPIKITQGQSVVVTPSDGEKTVQSLDQNKEYKFNQHCKKWEPYNTLFQSLLSIGIAFTAGIVIGFMMRSASK